MVEASTRTAGRWSFRQAIAIGALLAGMTASLPASAQATPPAPATTAATKAPPAAATQPAPAPAAKAAPAPTTKAAAAAATQPVPAPSTKDTPAAASPEAEAKRLYEEGVKLANAGQLENGRELLLASYRLKPSSKTAANLGRVELKAGKYVDAAEHFALVLQQETAMTADERKATEKMLAEAKAKIGTVTVRVDVDGADVLADGRPVGKSPLAAPVFVEPGSRQFKATKEGHGTGTLKLEVPAGLELEIKLTLALPQNVLPRSAAAQAPAPSSAPDARATPVPQTPPDTAGPKWRTWAMIGGAGLTAVGLGVGIGLTVAANAKSTSADEQLAAITRQTPTTSIPCGPNGSPLNTADCAELENTLSAQDRLRDGAAAMYVIGGVAALGTVGLLVWPKLTPRRTAVQVLPTLATDRAGMVVLGSF